MSRPGCWARDIPTPGRSSGAEALAPGEGWTERTVAWYERANARSDYAARALAAVADLIADSRSALDVGAGFGALAVPLARRLERVSALEPSPPMAHALCRATRRAGLGNLVVIEAAWGAAAVEPHDLVVCAHVGPLLRPGSAFLADVGRVARRGVLLVRDAAGSDDKFFFSELYPRLLGREYGPRYGEETELLQALEALGIAPTVTPIEYDSDQPFESLAEACDFWMMYMGLRREADRGFLGDFLAQRLRRHGHEWIAPLHKRAVVLQWRV